MNQGTVINSSFHIIRTWKWWEQIIKFFNKLSKTNQKCSLELQKVKHCLTIACKEVIEATQQRKEKYIAMKKLTIYT